MVVQYFPNRNLECFSSSLANLLMEKKDRKLAKSVFENYRSHPLVGDSGVMHLGISTRLVHDLTKGKYEATLYCEDLMTDLKQLTDATFPEITDKIVKIVQEEFNTGKVVINPGTVNYEYPAMLYLKGDIRSHWVVDAGNTLIIDNGQKKHIPYDSIGAKAVLVIKQV